jgi:hypothetical protein
MRRGNEPNPPSPWVKETQSPNSLVRVPPILRIVIAAGRSDPPGPFGTSPCPGIFADCFPQQVVFQHEPPFAGNECFTAQTACCFKIDGLGPPFSSDLRIRNSPPLLPQITLRSSVLPIGVCGLNPLPHRLPCELAVSGDYEQRTRTPIVLKTDERNLVLELGAGGNSPQSQEVGTRTGSSSRTTSSRSRPRTG